MPITETAGFNFTPQPTRQQLATMYKAADLADNLMFYLFQEDKSFMTQPKDLPGAVSRDDQVTRSELQNLREFLESDLSEYEARGYSATPFISCGGSCEEPQALLEAVHYLETNFDRLAYIDGESSSISIPEFSLGETSTNQPEDWSNDQTDFGRFYADSLQSSPAHDVPPSVTKKVIKSSTAFSPRHCA